MQIRSHHTPSTYTISVDVVFAGITHMKHFIENLVPRPVKSLARRIYWKFIDKPHAPEFSTEHPTLTALRFLVSYNKYGVYCVPESSRHRVAAQRVLAHDVYEPQTIEFLISHCGDGDIVHAGTYFGDFLPALSKACASRAKVWAFEPNSENFRCASITALINDLKNVELINAGLGEKNDTLLMKTYDESGRALGGASKVSSNICDTSGGIESVQIVTVDDRVGNDRDVSIIQFDVEGHEKEALSGAIKTIQRCLPIIIIEVLRRSTLLDSEWFSENIISLGYHMVDTIHGNAVFIYDHESSALGK